MYRPVRNLAVSPVRSTRKKPVLVIGSNDDLGVQLALSSLYFGNIDGKKAYGIAFEALAFGLVSFDIRKPGYPVAL